MTDTTDTADTPLAPIPTITQLHAGKTHVMHDIESWAKNSAIPVMLSIGAVKFNQFDILDRFEVRISTADCQRYGLEIEAETIEWWMDDDRQEARRQLHSMGAVDLFAALDGYRMWVAQTPAPELGSAWGNGSNFDNAKLKSIYDKVQVQWPFSYKQEECYRTMRNRFPDVPFMRLGIHHGALDDASSQATHLQSICNLHGIQL